MSAQRHPYADHPAALVLADHKAVLRDPPATPTRCDCGWTGPSCDHRVDGQRTLLIRWYW